MIRSFIANKLAGVKKFALRASVAAAALPVICTGSAFADATPVATLSGLSTNVNSILVFGSKILTNVSTVAGLALFFLGIFNLYTSHTKQSSGGKPMSHGLVMLGCGALLIGLPYVFQLAGNSVIGTHKVGGAISTINS
jgi:hypothetical protein